MTQKNKKLASNQVLLTFEDETTTDYVRKVCRRKATNLESYILDNFEWDSKLPCIDEGPLREDCKYCDFKDKCPDAIGSSVRRRSQCR